MSQKKRTWLWAAVAVSLLGWLPVTVASHVSAAPIVVTKEGSTTKAETELIRDKETTTTAQAVRPDTAKKYVKIGAVPIPYKEQKEYGPPIRVLLGTRTTPWTASGTGIVSLYDANNNPWQRGVTGTDPVLAARNGFITINNKPVGSTVYVRTWVGKEPAGVTVGSHTYRGAIKVVANGNSMLLINEVPLEQYLYGVVPQEAVPSWPAAALKAQAVAARSYALYTMAQNKGKAYDIRPSTYNQVYLGQGGEYASTNVAVDDTRGQVLTYNNAPIEALFHSDGGGYTEDSVNVWGSNVPYLRGVKDYSHNAGTSAWTVALTRQSMEQKLRAAGKDVGTLKQIQLSTLRQRPMNTPDRGVSGRIKQAVLVGSARSLVVTGEQLQAIFGLKSTLFDFYVNVTPPTSADQFKNPKAYHTFRSANDRVYIRGYGWGHGLGLSQWGAAAMAESGPHSDNYYQTILLHYYPGTKLQQLY